MDFFKAYFKSVNEDFRIRFDKGPWQRVRVKGDEMRLVDEKGRSWWPKQLIIESDKWEIERPSPPLVYGACDDDGASFVYAEAPFRDNCIWGVSDDNMAVSFSEKNLFPKSEPLELRLVPAGQPYIPWRKFDIDEMPEEEFQFLGIMKTGTRIMDEWVLRIDGIVDRWDTIAYPPFGIAYYCPIDEIPGPETE